MTIVGKLMRRARMATVVLLALAGIPATARGAAPSPGWERRQAERDAAEGRRLLRQGQFDEALFKLQSAYAVEPATEILLDLAEAQRGAGRTLDAYASYEALLHEHAVDLSGEQRQAVQSALNELGQKTGTLKLSVDAEANVAIDGDLLPANARRKPIRLLIGGHKVAVSKAGTAAAIYDVIIRRGREAEVPPPVLGALPPAPPPAPASASASAGSVHPVAPPPAAALAAPPPRVAPPPPAPPPPAPPAPVVAPPPAAPPVVAPAPAAPPVAVPPPPGPGVEPLPAIPAPIPEESAPPPVPPPVEGPPPAVAPDAEDPLRVGLMIGLLSFPRPVEAELTFKVGRWFGFGVQASFLPQVSVPAIDGKLDLKAMQGVFRWYPFGNAFYLGGGLGYQNFQGSFGETIDNGQLRISADMSGAFLVPQLGWMWIFESGFAMGLSFGLQIPIPKEPVVTATYNGQPVPDQATSTVPQDVVNEAHTTGDNFRSVAKLIVRYPFPQIDFLRIGLFF